CQRRRSLRFTYATLFRSDLHRHGTIGASPQAEIPWRRAERRKGAAVQRMSVARHGWTERLPAGRIAYVNGRYVPHSAAAVHIEDRGLQFADAIYEVVGVAGGQFLDEEEHLDRLERSVGEIGMATPMPRAPLK